MTIPESELEAIEKACREATPGPWSFEEDDYTKEIGTTLGIGSPGWPDDIVRTDSGVYPPIRPDAVFITKSREWLPALVAEVRALAQYKTWADNRMMWLATAPEARAWTQDAVRTERELCAMVAGKMAHEAETDAGRQMADAIAEAIRKRGSP